MRKAGAWLLAAVLSLTLCACGQKTRPTVGLGRFSGEQVSVYTIGDFSKEVCGGPHVEHTGAMGHFKILKESSSSAGVRRIKAVLEH